MGAHFSNVGSVVTPGNYDGVHLGHRSLLEAARQVALQATPKLRVVAMAFDPHPVHFVTPERAPELLTEPARRAELLRGLGADQVVFKRFDADFSALSPVQFVDRVLGEELSARAVVVGDDFRFGANRAGDVAMLAELGRSRGITVVDRPKVQIAGDAVSSSRIRRSLAQGDVALAARMLARLHDVTRVVVRGQQLGRTIGIPTANLDLPGTMLPCDGVYAVVARVLGEHPSQLLHGVANLGKRPTVAAGRSFEVHLFDFARDIYDLPLRVGFVARLRDEQRFPDLSALKAQIARDIEAARNAIAHCEAGHLSWI